jgi:hypothetical protein
MLQMALLVTQNFSLYSTCKCNGGGAIHYTYVVRHNCTREYILLQEG